METNNNQPKIGLSVRVSPQHKELLVQEAKQLGTTLSEHAERILLNGGAIAINDDAERLKQENAFLAKQLQSLQSQPSILNNLALLNLFEQLKGRNDEILTPDGKTLSITYNSPLDLLIAMIHSYRLKP